MSQSYLHGYFYKEGAWKDIQENIEEGAKKVMEWAKANPEWAGAIGAGAGGAGVGALANGWRGALTGSLAAVPGYLGGKWWESSQEAQQAAQQASDVKSRIQDKLKKTERELTELRRDPVRAQRNAYREHAMEMEDNVLELHKKLRKITEQKDTAKKKQRALLRILEAKGPEKAEGGPLFSGLGSTIKKYNPITEAWGLGKDVTNVIGTKLRQLEGKRQLTIQELQQLADINKIIQRPKVMGEMSSEDIESLSRRLKKLNEKYNY